MRIALVSQQVSPVETPPSTELAQYGTRMRELAGELVRGGHQVAVYARQSRPELPKRCRVAGGVVVEHLDAPATGACGDEALLEHVPALSAGLRARWRRQPPDVVHALDWVSGTAALVAGREVGVPVAQTFPSLGAALCRRHAGEVSRERIRLEPAVGRGADAVLATTSAEASELTDLGVRYGSIRVVPCGVDTDRFQPSGPTAKRTGRPRLVAAAPLTAHGGLDTLIRSMPRMPGVELVVTCELSRRQLEADDVYRRLAILARRLDVAERIVFACQVSGTALPALYRSADVFVDAAWYQPCGLSTLQAMACGVPVVATAVDSHVDIVVDGVTGSQVPPGQPGQLAERIRWLLGQATLRECFGTAGADRARARYSWGRIGSETIAAYRSVATAA